MADITAIILTKNEELNIVDCIRSISSVVKRIVVVDDFSKDRTAQLALKEGAEVYLHPFENYAKQYVYATRKASINTTWMRMKD